MSAPLQTIELETGPAPTASIVWLHGLGADGNDFVPIATELGLPDDLQVRFVFPHAPMMPVTLNGGYVMRAWYDVSYDGIEKKPDEAGIRASQAAIEQLLAREKSRGIAAERIVLAGFSQGGAMTLHTGLRHAQRLAGLMVLSSYLPLPHALAAERHDANADTPIFMVHGEDDPVIAIELAERSVQQLQAAGYDVEWRSYPMEHSVCMEEIAHLGAWLRRVLAT